MIALASVPEIAADAPPIVPHEHFDASRPPRTIFGLVRDDGTPIPLHYDEAGWRATTWPDILIHRLRIQMATAGADMASEDVRAAQRALCAQDGPDGLLYWLYTFGWILEPRNDGVNTRLPFIPYPRQLDLIDWVYWVMAQPIGRYASGLVEKARSVGATWIAAAHTAKHWQFDPHMWVSGVISKTDEEVDNKADPGSYFWKLDYLLKNQPDWLLPAGFAGFHERSPHRSHAKIINPATDSIVVGSTTTDLAFVGKRLKKLDIDEGATLEGFDEIWANTASVTDHRIVYTTPRTRHTMGVYNLRYGHDGYISPAIFSFRWHEVPGRDEYWYASMRETMQDEKFEREINLNWRSDQGEFVYPHAWDIAPRDSFGFVPGWPIRVGIDDGWDDEFAIVWMQKDLAHNRWRVIAGYQYRGQPMKYYGQLLMGMPTPEFHWGERERELMAWIREYGIFNAVYYGDRHGDNTDLSSGKSPFQVLTEQTGIIVITAPDPNRNDLKFRIDAMNEAMPRIDVHTEHGALEVLDAFQNSRYPRRRETAQPTNEVRGPIHDSTAHFCAAAQYIFVNEQYESLVGRRGPSVRQGVDITRRYTAPRGRRGGSLVTHDGA